MSKGRNACDAVLLIFLPRIFLPVNRRREDVPY